jgi:PQQ-like domain
MASPDKPEQYGRPGDATTGPPGRPSAVGWSQFHADGPSQGSLFVATDFALQPKWEFDVGSVFMSSPVIGPDGAIHVGNVNGEIIAVRPDGSEKWRVTTPFRIYSSTVVAGDGTVYAIGTSFFPNATFPDHKFRSVLITIQADGTPHKLTLLPDQGFTAGSPKLWADGRDVYVLLHAYMRSDQLSASAVLVFDGGGAHVARLNLGCRFQVGSSNFFQDLLDVLTLDFDDSNPTPVPPDAYGWIDPTVALVARRDLAGDGNIVVFAADQRCSNVTAAVWDPPELHQLWQVDEADKFIARSSPAAVNEGQLLVTAREDGKVIGRNPATGEKLWTHDAITAVRGTPASLGGLVYYTSTSHIRSLDPVTGEIVHERRLPDPTSASLALSGNKAHVSHVSGFQTLTLDLQSSSDDSEASGGGHSSPAIALDGTVYTVVRRGGTSLLRAYPAP